MGNKNKEKIRYITKDGKEHTTLFNREKYKKIKRMDRQELEFFLIGLHEEAYRKGKEEAQREFKKQTEPINFEQFKQILLGIKGIGEVKANQIIQALGKVGGK